MDSTENQASFRGSKAMRVTHFNTYEIGGAARAALRLHLGLAGAGIESCFSVKRKVSTDDTVEQLAHSETPLANLSILDRVRRKLEHHRLIVNGDNGLDESLRDTVTYASFPRSPYLPEQLQGPRAPDIYNLHWVAGLLDWQNTLPWLVSRAPLVWTLHDLNPMQGIWHYDPVDADPLASLADIDKDALKIKHEGLAQLNSDRVCIVGPSRWISEKAKASDLLGRFDIHTIPYGLDTKKYRTLDKGVIKEFLGLPSDRLIIGFAADNVGDPRKGSDILRAALAQLVGQSFFELSIGAGHPADHRNDQRLHLGRVESDDLMVLFYNACDVFVCPSRQDNLPNTILESMACGVPVIGSNVGGIPDMVRPGKTGWLFPNENAEALAETIREAINHPEHLKEFGANARAACEKEYSLKMQAKAYISLYEELLERATHSA